VRRRQGLVRALVGAVGRKGADVTDEWPGALGLLWLVAAVECLTAVVLVRNGGPGSWALVPPVALVAVTYLVALVAVLRERHRRKRAK
jgi:peptidoglycan/LPS O-acetylase OafA/YrhL